MKFYPRTYHYKNLEGVYPLIIVEDKYNGAYSGGKWLAFSCYPQEISNDIFGEDVECASFWSTHTMASYIGRGANINEAVLNLSEKYQGGDNLVPNRLIDKIRRLWSQIKLPGFTSA